MNERPIDPRNLRPLSVKLLMVCSVQNTCHKCPMRQGCPKRYDFYVSDIQFEIEIQRAELIAAPIIGEANAFNASQSIRSKRICEMRDNPAYSFK